VINSQDGATITVLGLCLWVNVDWLLLMVSVSCMCVKLLLLFMLLFVCDSCCHLQQWAAGGGDGQGVARRRLKEQRLLRVAARLRPGGRCSRHVTPRSHLSGLPQYVSYDIHPLVEGLVIVSARDPTG